VENRIEFPQDDECAMLGMLMHLYGFHEIDWVQAVFVDRFIPAHAIIELHKVATKYSLPKLASGAMNFFADTLEECMAALVSGRDWDNGFLLGVARHLYGDEDVDESPLLVEYLLQIRIHWPVLVEVKGEFLRGLMEDCPRLAADLLFGGGFQHQPVEDMDEIDSAD